MIARIVTELGPWNWMVLGFVLLGLEILVPGFFLLWIGLAALATGALSLLLWGSALWPWEVHGAARSWPCRFVLAFAGRRIMKATGDVSDQPLLNRRGDQLVGRTATLTEPIVNGRGRMKIGDTLWRVTGPDLPAGATVRVAGATDLDLELRVEPA